MRFKIKKCPKCERYTLKDTCPVCGEKTKLAHPPKFSPEDPYGEYRRRLKKEMLGIGVKK
ncbi:RNA-protein complex protein Nop10 [Thermococci archaeon]|nr:MAG: RNA-protein complex protein Nop10 [Thermococci archaeon]